MSACPHQSWRCCGHPPRHDARHRPCPCVHPDALDRYAMSQATSQANPHPKPWLGAHSRASSVIQPLPPANGRRPPSDPARTAHMYPTPRVNPNHTSQLGSFAKETLSFISFASRSFHLEISFQAGPFLYMDTSTDLVYLYMASWRGYGWLNS